MIQSKESLSWQVTQTVADPKLSSSNSVYKVLLFLCGTSRRASGKTGRFTELSVLMGDVMPGPQADAHSLNAVVVREMSESVLRGERRLDVCEVQSRGVRVCFPLEACHSPHVIERGEKERERKSSPSGIHLLSLFCLRTKEVSLPFIPPYKRTTWAQRQERGCTEKKSTNMLHRDVNTDHTNTEKKFWFLKHQLSPPD